MRIFELNTESRREVKRFIKLPFSIYSDSEQWVPPIIPDARLQLNRQKFPFYKHNDAAYFIAEKNGQDVGRIGALHPAFYNDFKDENNVHFYLFESINDQEVAKALFDVAAEWGKARGLDVIRGPLGYMAADGFGMLAEGFEHRPAIGIPYNHAYYIDLTESWGFELEEKVLSGYVDIGHMVEAFPERVLRIAEKVKQRYGFEIATYDTKREIRKSVAPRLAELYNRTLTHIAGDPPLSQEEVDTVADNLLMVSDPDLLKFIMKDGEIIGFLFCFLDISEGIKKARGQLFPFGLVHILRDLKRTKWLNLNGMGILPEYQGKGGTAVMYAELYKAVLQNPRFDHGDVVQISEFNAQSLNEMPKFGVKWYKTHHIYRKAL